MRDMLLEKARLELRKEILPIEQIPEITESLSQIFRDSNLTFIGNENQLLSSILPLMQIIADKVKAAMPAEQKAIEPQKTGGEPAVKPFKK
jgi:hypothetical protein